ncbi:MAG: SBBP repeat-containing protein, partial [Proteobacteria bacterium]|nr:SBBP repeat-containing protein [Pseudomonadota bacterium]
RFNYLLGKDQSRWQRDVPSYGAVLYREAYPGIDLKFYGNGRELEYDLIVRPGADLSRVKFRYRGIAGLKVDAKGNLAVKLPDGGLLLQKKPIVYQVIDGRRVAREGRFRLLKPGGTEYGFVVAAYDKTRPLIIDPVLVYSTYLGGSSEDNISGVAVDQQGNVYVTGVTNSTDFPGYPEGGDGYHPFVAKLNAAGTALVYSTVFGSGFGEWTDAIAVDGAGNAYVAGNAQNSGLPLIPPTPICTYQGGRDAFVIKFNPAGNTMLYATYLGGTGDENPWSIAVDGTGQAYVTGQTQSIDYITTPTSLHPGPLGGGDGFVSKINTAGTALVYSTYLGGSKEDTPACITADGSGNAYVTGQTYSSTDFTTLTPMRPWAGPPTDAFIAKLNPNGTAMLNFTYLGGSLPATRAADGGNGIALDQAGNIYVTGSTSSEDFPRVNAFQNSKVGVPSDAFVAKIDAAWSGLVYSTYLGGSLQDGGQKIGVDGAGCAYVMGATLSGSNFPTKNSLQPYRAISDYFGSLFVTKFSPSGRSLVYSTFLGGSLESMSSLYSLAVDRAGNAYVAGGTRSTNYPTTKNALHPDYLGGFTDGFVTKIATPVSGAAVDLLLLLD